MAKKTAPPQPKPSVPPPPAGILELDRFSEASLTKWNELSHDIDQLANELFYSVRPEQKRLREDILGAIRSVAGKAFQIDNWSRIVTYKYSLQPLSCAGSMLTVGGRFNPGAELDADTMAPFPALYMAQDYETAFREKFQIASDKTVEGLKPQELALEHGASHSTIQLRGQVHNVFDMTIKHLDTAAAVFRRIKMPDRAKALKKKLAMKDLRMVTTGLELHRAALEYNWRQGPVQFGLPAPSQVLAEFIRAAGFEGILYKSTKGPGSCLALFPDRLQDQSFVELADPAPAQIKHTRLDSGTCVELSGYDLLPSQAKKLLASH